MSEMFAEYPEDNIKGAKLGIERTIDLRYNLKYSDILMYECNITDIRFNHKFSDIKSIDIKIKNSCPFVTVRVNGIGGNVLLGYITFDEKFDFDKVLNGTAKVYPAHCSGIVSKFTNIFCEIDTKSNDTDRPYKAMELKKILKLYNEFLDNYDEYAKFESLLSYCRKVIEDKYINFNPEFLSGNPMIEDYAGKNKDEYGDMNKGLYEFTKEIVNAWNELPKRYKPVKYKTLDSLTYLMHEFSKALITIYTDKIKEYQKYIEEINTFMYHD